VTVLDEAAARARIEACLALAAAVDHAADVRRGAAAVARVEWRGPAREAFDGELRALEREASGLVGDLRARAAAIERELEAARAEAAWGRSRSPG